MRFVVIAYSLFALVALSEAGREKRRFMQDVDKLSGRMDARVARPRLDLYERSHSGIHRHGRPRRVRRAPAARDDTLTPIAIIGQGAISVADLKAAAASSSSAAPLTTPLAAVAIADDVLAPVASVVDALLNASSSSSAVNSTLSGSSTQSARTRLRGAAAARTTSGSESGSRSRSSSSPASRTTAKSERASSTAKVEAAGADVLRTSAIPAAAAKAVESGPAPTSSLVPGASFSARVVNINGTPSTQLVVVTPSAVVVTAAGANQAAYGSAGTSFQTVQAVVTAGGAAQAQAQADQISRIPGAASSSAIAPMLAVGLSTLAVFAVLI